MPHSGRLLASWDPAVARRCDELTDVDLQYLTEATTNLVLR
jgi:hypothetical protein